MRIMRRHACFLVFARLLFTELACAAGADFVAADSVVESSINSGNNSYVFLQKFPLEGTDHLLFHTEVLVCSKEGFSSDDQKNLDAILASLEDFSEIDESWWSLKTADCVEMGYGGAACKDRCCSVPHGQREKKFPLNERRAVIGNAVVEEKELFLYGAGEFDGEAAYHAVCKQKCWSNWAGTDYNPLTNNCNTFTSTVLRCVFGLSEKKPNLGPSDMITVNCEKRSCSPSNDVVGSLQGLPVL